MILKNGKVSIYTIGLKSAIKDAFKTITKNKSFRHTMTKLIIIF